MGRWFHGRLQRAMMVAVLAVLALWAAAVVCIVVAGRGDNRGPADAIIVLGAAQYVGHPSPVLQARLDHAADLWRTQVAPFIILTGGVGHGDTISEADVGRRYMRARGIPDSAILLERTGKTTGQSVRAAIEILHERHLASAVLVSDPFHVLRLRIIASRLGLKAVTSPTRTSPITRNAAREWRYVLSESLKLPIAALFPNE